MNDLRTSVLTARLNQLADDLVPSYDATGEVHAARSRHRRERHRRMAVGGVLAAAAAVAVTVPLTLGSLTGSPTPGDVARTGTSTPAAAPPPAPTTQPGTPPAPAATPADAGLAEAVALLTQPLEYTASADLGDCPPDAGPVNHLLHTSLTYIAGSEPDRGPSGCQYTSDPLASSPPEQRYAVGIGFLVGTTTEQMRQGVAAETGGRCRSVDVPAVHPDAVLQRCSSGGTTDWWLNVPDTDGAGIWVVNATVGDGWQGSGGAAGIAALGPLAATTW
jgi:hypothetical protein